MLSYFSSRNKTQSLRLNFVMNISRLQNTT